MSNPLEVFGKAYADPLDERQYANLDLTTEDVDLGALSDEIKAAEADKEIVDMLFKGADVRQFNKEIEAQLRQVEIDSIQDYIKEADKFVTLHREIQQCDTILEAIEDMLSGFQVGLGEISNEIKTLRVGSLSMKARLDNRKAVASRLDKYIGELAIPQSLAQRISKGTVDDDYLQAVEELNSKITNVNALTILESTAANESLPKLEKLKRKALQRIKQFLLHTFESLKPSTTNVMDVREVALRKKKFFLQFLEDHDAESAKAIIEKYFVQFSDLYLIKIRDEATALLKHVVLVGSKEDTLGATQSLASRVGGVFRLGRTKGDKPSVFAMGTRHMVLESIPEGSLKAPSAGSDQQWYFEMVFRALHVSLIRFALREHKFCTEFFRQPDMAELVFQKVTTLLFDLLREHLANSHDAIGILLMIRVVDYFKTYMEAFQCPTLDTYLQRLVMEMRVKFQLIFDENIRSIELVNAKSVAGEYKQVHYIVRRYAEFAASIQVLNKLSDDNVVPRLHRLRTKVHDLLNTIATETSSNLLHQLIFRLNNYDHIVVVFDNNHLRAGVDEVDFFDHELKTHSTHFVEEQLQACFQSFVRCVRNSLPRLEAEDLRELQSDCKSAAQIFTSEWKKGLKRIEGDICTSFCNMQQASELLQELCKRFMEYYDNFIKISKKCWPKQQPDEILKLVPRVTVHNECLAICKRVQEASEGSAADN